MSSVYFFCFFSLHTRRRRSSSKGEKMPSTYNDCGLEFSKEGRISKIGFYGKHELLHKNLFESR